jgi:hypothetical protein
MRGLFREESCIFFWRPGIEIVIFASMNVTILP